MAKPDRERPVFRIDLEALPSEIPPEIRLRAVLKMALRRCELKCLRVEELPAGGAGKPASAEAEADQGKLEDPAAADTPES
jgi:hypothetical protein